MIHRIVICALVLTLVACKSKDNVLTEEVSPSGLSYTHIKMPGNSRITIQIAWPTDWVYANDRDPVVPVIGTRLIFAGGATGYPAGETIERISDMNTDGNLWPEADHVFGELHFSPEHLNETLQIANAHLRSPALDEKWFARIRDQYAGQVNEERALPKEQGINAFWWAVIQDSPLRKALLTPEENAVESVKRSDVREWIQTVFKRNGAIIAVAGDLTAAEAGNAVDKLFEGLPEGQVTAAGTSKSEISGKRILLHAPDSPTSTLSFVGRLPAASEGSYYQDRIIADALSGGLESGLFGAVRTELRASYTFSAQIQEINNALKIIIFTGEVETAKLAGAEKAVREAYAEFRSTAAVKNLSALKRPYITGLKEDLKDTGSVAYDAMISKVFGMDSSRALKLVDEIEAITEESVKSRVTTAFPNAKDLIVIVDSPDAKALPEACVITVPKDALDC